MKINEIIQEKELRKDPWNYYPAPVGTATPITGDPENPGKPYKTLDYDPEQLRGMERVAAQQKDPELVNNKLNIVPLETDEYGVGLTFGSQASVDARNRSRRRRAFQDMEDGSETGVDWSKYTPQEIAKIKQDAQMSDDEFGKSILDNMEKDTGVKLDFDRKLQQDTGGIVIPEPKIEHGKELGKQAEKERMIRYRTGTDADRRRMRKFDPNNPEFDRLDQESNSEGM
jgi:hypothetical protein